MRVLVCGGRDFADREKLASVLDSLHAQRPFSTVIHGAAPGADTLAGEWAMSRGITVAAFPADWKGQGRAAGPIRNKRMLDEGHPDLVIAMPGGRGTANMVAQAQKAGVAVRQF